MKLENINLKCTQNGANNSSSLFCSKQNFELSTTLKLCVNPTDSEFYWSWAYYNTISYMSIYTHTNTKSSMYEYWEKVYTVYYIYTYIYI